MTKKRYLAMAGLLVILVGVGISVTMMLSHMPGVTKANFDRIQEGMTQTEVVALMGRPPDKVEQGKMKEQQFMMLSWYKTVDKGGFVYLLEQKVILWEWIDSDETPWEKLRRWLGL